MLVEYLKDQGKILVRVKILNYIIFKKYLFNIINRFKLGFKVTPSAYGLETAFVAEFTSKCGEGRVISFNSE